MRRSVGKINSNIIFCAFAAFIVALTILCASLGNAEDQRNRDNYARYKEADRVFLDGKPDEALKSYQELASAFPKAYIIEYKAAVCEYNLKNYEAALSHGRRALEMHPYLAQDSAYLMMMEACFNETSDEASAEVVSKKRSTLE